MAEDKMAEDKKARPRPVNIKIDVDDETGQGVYTNLTMVNHNETEFVLDFVFVSPGTPKAKLRSRVIMSPRHAKRFLAAMARNVEMYEAKFGPIPQPPKAAPAPPPGGGTIVQ